MHPEAGAITVARGSRRRRFLPASCPESLRIPGLPGEIELEAALYSRDPDALKARFTIEEQGDFYELQQEFMFSVLAPFLTGLVTPLTGALVNPERQRNDLPDRLA